MCICMGGWVGLSLLRGCGGGGEEKLYHHMIFVVNENISIFMKQSRTT